MIQTRNRAVCHHNPQFWVELRDMIHVVREPWMGTWHFPMCLVVQIKNELLLNLGTKSGWLHLPHLLVVKFELWMSGCVCVRTTLNEGKYTVLQTKVYPFSNQNSLNQILLHQKVEVLSLLGQYPVQPSSLRCSTVHVAALWLQNIHVELSYCRHKISKERILAQFRLICTNILL